MSNFKVSIIMPVYNSQKYLEDALDSIISQSIGFENLEVIIVNDASTDNTKDIIDTYCERYSNFKVIHLTENIGAAYGPRNIALKEVSADYIMFLDADDTFKPNACEILYDEINSSKADIVFGRYYRVYDDIELKSYSPYDSSDNDIKINPRFNRLISFLWSNIIYRVLYGGVNSFEDKIVINDIRENPEILKILPSIWTKIVRKDSVTEFPKLITGEDLNFILDVYNNGKIVFLNNEFITNYSMRFNSSEELSITKNVNFSLVLDSIKAYKLAIYKCNEYKFPKYNKMINPFLLNYISLLNNVNLFNKEKQELLTQIIEIDKSYKNRGFVGFLLVELIKILSRV